MAPWRRGRTWLLTAAFIVVPFAGVILLAYGLGRFLFSLRRKADGDREWLTFRGLMRSRRSNHGGLEAALFGEAPRSPGRRLSSPLR